MIEGIHLKRYLILTYQVCPCRGRDVRLKDLKIIIDDELQERLVQVV
jgi:hypothetical protein